MALRINFSEKRRLTKIKSSPILHLQEEILGDLEKGGQWHWSISAVMCNIKGFGMLENSQNLR